MVCSYWAPTCWRASRRSRGQRSRRKVFDSFLSLSWVSLVIFLACLCHPLVSSVLRHCRENKQKKKKKRREGGVTHTHYRIMLRRGLRVAKASVLFFPSKKQSARQAGMWNQVNIDMFLTIFIYFISDRFLKTKGGLVDVSPTLISFLLFISSFICSRFFIWNLK